MKKHIMIFIFTLFISFIGISSICASDNLLETETDKKVIFVSDEDGAFKYSWSFDKDEYKNKAFDFDLGINFTSQKKDEINKIVGNIKKEFISFDYHGDLPSTATIKVPINNKFKDGDILHLYYYNEETKKIEEIDSYVKVVNGHATFEIEHCSDYFLTMSIVKESEKSNPGEENFGIIIIGMIVVVIGLVGYTIIKNKNN